MSSTPGWHGSGAGAIKGICLDHETIMAQDPSQQKILQPQASPEHLDQLIQLIRPRAWIALGGLGLLVLAGVLWAIFGTISTTVQAQGILVRRGDVLRLAVPGAPNSSESQIVAHLHTRIGREVQPHDRLLDFAPGAKTGAANTARRPAGEADSLFSPCHARVLDILAKTGDAVRPHTDLVILDPLEEPLQVLLYVPVQDGYKVQEGNRVAVLPAPVRKNEFGYLVGTVTTAARYPASEREIARRLMNDTLASAVAAGGPCLEIVVHLTPDPHTRTGYRWSSSQGPPLELASYTPCRALITVETLRPIQLLFPGLACLAD
jgi:hypothetical protein